MRLRPYQARRVRPDGYVTLNPASPYVRGLVFCAPFIDHTIDLVSGVQGRRDNLPFHRIVSGHGRMLHCDANLIGIQYVEFPHVPAMASPSANFSLHCWFRRYADVNGKVFLGQGAAGVHNDLTIFPDGNIYWQFNGQDSAFAASDFFKHQLVMTFDGTAANGDRVRMWYDGVEQSVADGGTIVCPVNTDPFTVGVNAQSGQATKGDIGDVWIWDRTLTAAEVEALYYPDVRWDLYQAPTARVFFDVTVATELNVFLGEPTLGGSVF